MSPLYRMRIQYLLTTSPLPGNAPWTMKINTPKFNMWPTFVQRHPQRSLITMTTMTLRRPVVTAVTNRPDHITTVLPRHNKKGGGQKLRLTWTIHVAWHQFSSTTMQQKRGGHKLNLHGLPYCWLFPCFHCMWRSVSLCWCSGLSFFSWYFSWCLFFSTRKPQIQNTPFKSIIAVKIENLNDVTEGQVHV